MDSFKDSLTFWASILGTLVGLIGVLQSVTWLVGIGALAVVGSIGATVYARRERSLIRLAALRIEGRSIDSFNIASLRRRLNRSLVLQGAHNIATIVGEDLTITWECTGYCRAQQEGAVEFSVDTDHNIPFDELDCFAYDLRHDPGKTHKIRPILVGSDGISKKIAVPFLAPLRSQEPFSVVFTCTLPGCMKDGVEYYTASLSFDNSQTRQYSVRLVFLREQPEWLRVYECSAAGAARLLKDMKPVRETDELSEYRDAAGDVPSRSARIYVFRRVREVRAAALRRAA